MAEPYEALSRRRFYWECTKHAFSGKWRILEAVELAIVLGLSPLLLLDRIQGPVSILVWALPLTVFFGTVVVGYVAAPYMVYEPVAEKLAAATAPVIFPNVEVEKHMMEVRPIVGADGHHRRVVVLHGVRITNRSDQKVSLGFKLHLYSENDSYTVLTAVPQANIPPGAFGLGPFVWLAATHDMDARSSVIGNIGFATYVRPDERDRDDWVAIKTELEVVDFLSGASVKFDPGRGYPPMGGGRPQADLFTSSTSRKASSQPQ